MTLREAELNEETMSFKLLERCRFMYSFYKCSTVSLESSLPEVLSAVGTQGSWSILCCSHSSSNNRQSSQAVTPEFTEHRVQLVMNLLRAVVILECSICVVLKL